MGDYEKKFEEDLERAQALSLESLALEQFKNRRVQELNKSLNTGSTKKFPTVVRASSMNESDSVHIKYDRQTSKSRPRPGTSLSVTTGSIIAPPPQFQRKNSTATDSQDLISFTSPPSGSINDFSGHEDLLSSTPPNPPNNIQTSLPTNIPIPPTVLSQMPQMPQYWPRMSQMPYPLPTSAAYQQPLMASQVNMVRYYYPTLNQMVNPVPRLNNPNMPSSNMKPNNTLNNFNMSTVNVPNLAGTNVNDGQNNLSHPLNTVNPNQIGFKCLSLQGGTEMVDGGRGQQGTMRQSESHGRTMSPVYSVGDDTKSIAGSVYDDYYDYDFIYSGSGNNSLYSNSIYGNSSLSEPIYATVNKTENCSSPTPPLPPRALMSTIDRKIGFNFKKNLLDEIVKKETKDLTTDPDLKAFYQMVHKVRNVYKHNDPDTNMGLVISPIVNFKYNEGLSIKLRVHPDFEGADFNKPVSFTCDVTSSVEHITMQLVCDLEAPTHQNYTLKVWGFNEYLVPTTLLSDYEYVHNCIKLDEDVMLVLIPDFMIDKSFARTVQDDNNDKDLKYEQIAPSEKISHINFDSLKILIETVESEMNKLEQQAEELERTTDMSSMPTPLKPVKVIQSVKYIVNLMGDLCTLDITQSIQGLQDCCGMHVPSNNGMFSESIKNNCNKIRYAIQSLIEMYAQAFTVNFGVKSSGPNETVRLVHDIHDKVTIRITAICRPSAKWEHEQYHVCAQLYHGCRKVSRLYQTQDSPKIDRDAMWPSRIVFDNWLEIEEVPISNLARESRLVLQIFGKTLDTAETEENKNSSMPVYKQEEIAWTAVQFFNYEGLMIQGNMLSSVWPVEPNHINDHIYGPAPAPGTHPLSDHPMIGIEIVAPPKVQFPKVAKELLKKVVRGDFESLDRDTRELLADACDQDMLYKFPAEVREILWEKRHHLYHIPQALPKILLAAHSWAYVNLPDLHGMLKAWSRLDPTQALELLLPVYPDMEVRKMAVQWIIINDDLIDYLPQLLVALRYETYENSALAQFLLHRALRSPRFSHYLFWLLCHSLPGSVPQNGFMEIKDQYDSVSEVRHHRRMKLILRALLAVCGESLRKCFISQQLLVKQLNDVAENVQKTKDSQKMTNLHRDLEQVNLYLNENPTSLPLSPTLKVNGIDVKTCSYFQSNTLPLKINFKMKDSSTYPAIYKVGDDLQQDVLTLQMIKLMDKLWLQKGLDLKMVAFNCMPTSRRKGMIEMVTKADTLRKIQTEHGLTGSFKDKPIAEWLAKHNPSELEYARAVQNFTASCAGYCVVTYVMGICDRHNDNIMLKTSGHLFHIDFGKFLGDAQMFGNFKRDRAPFVLTSDMAYVINGGDRPTAKFHQFVDLCCQAFNIIRNNRNIFLYLMTCSGICSITPESIGYMHKALLPELSNPEAAAHFTRLIEESLKTKFTQFNFFLHNLAQNLAQLKFTGDNSTGSLLSFVPKTYSMATDGKLTLVEVVGYRKRYDPDKYYVYVLRVYRENQIEPMEIQRTYKEFCELHQKLCMCFPLAKLHSLSTGLHMGRQNIKQVAQKRFHEISLFVKSLFLCATEIAHSDLVYTFFHPLLRDQQEDELVQQLAERRASSAEAGILKGQLKLTLLYSKGVFSVMVQHARGLPRLNGQEPSTYVKVYLHPDPQKTTKRKTKVVKKNCHPCFMEMLEYRMTLEVVTSRTLKATVWNYDPLQENEFMGGVELELESFDLTCETTEWFPLVNLSR